MTTPNEGGPVGPEHSQLPPPPPGPPSAPTAPPQAPPSGGSTAASAPAVGSDVLAKIKDNKLVVIGGIAVVALAVGMGSLLLGPSKRDSNTQQLTAIAPSTEAVGVPEGFEIPAPDATGRIIDTETLAVDRESVEVTVVKVDPSTYAQVGEWWARANDQGMIYLPPGKQLADATFFSADDQTVPYAGQTSEEKGTVTSVTFEKGAPGGFNLSPGAQVWYTDASFQTDPAYLLIPKGLEGSFQVYVGSVPIELALP